MDIYVDMDGVLCDFERQVAELIHVPAGRIKSLGNSSKMWGAINKAGEKFWSGMHWMADGHQLWDAVKKYKPTILTSPSGHPSSIQGKKKWIQKNMPGTPFIIEHDKKKYADKDAILIDDRNKNINAWRNAGGIGILHRDTLTTITKLNELMSKRKTASESVQDPINPDRKIVIEKLRGGRSTKVIPQKKGKGSYQRVKKIDVAKEASYQQMIQDITTPIIKRIDYLEKQYEEMKRAQPTRAQQMDQRYQVEDLLDDLKWRMQGYTYGRTDQDLHAIEDKLKDLEHALNPIFQVGDFLKKSARRVVDAYIARDTEAIEPIRNFKFQKHPVVIDPYDELVQKAVMELGPSMDDVDVIKLEPVCPAGKAAWVSNIDLFQGQKSKKRVIHLCLKDIKDKFKKQFGQPYTVTDPNEQDKMKGIVKQYLTDVVLPHETAHIHQEMQHGGKFGPSAEPQAERAEQWKTLEQMGIKKKASDCGALTRKVLAKYMKCAAEKKLVILRGISGTGKSTLARQVEQELGVPAFSSDDFFMKNGMYEFDPKLIGKAHQWNAERAQQAMAAGKPVIVDNTNTQAWEMKPYVSEALKHGYNVEFREPNWSAELKDDQGRWNVDFIEKLQQNPDRANIGKTLPREVLERMNARYEPNVDVETVMKSKAPWES